MSDLLYSSVKLDIGGVVPPKARAADVVPAPPKPDLAVARVAGLVVQLLPSYSSVAAILVVVCPEIASAAVKMPAPAKA